MQVFCGHCKKGFHTHGALYKHHSMRPRCAEAIAASMGIATRTRSKKPPASKPPSKVRKKAPQNTKKAPPKAPPFASLPPKQQESTDKQKNALVARLAEELVEEDRLARAELDAMEEEEMDSDLEDVKMPGRSTNEDETDDDLVPMEHSDDEGSVEEDSDQLGNASNEDVEDQNEDEVMSSSSESEVGDNLGVPDTSIRDRFRQYCAKAKAEFAELTEQETTGIKLMHILQQKKAPLNAYDDLMEWYLDGKGLRVAGEKLGECPEYISRNTLIKNLAKRYNMMDKFPFTKSIVLPNSGARVDVVCHDARQCVAMLLTNPRLRDKDFAFFDENPHAPPPKKPVYVGDLNTGQAYLNGYNEWVTNPEKQIGVGVQWYIDGAVTGQFENLQITALKMTLSLFTREYRMKDEAWATVGYIMNYSVKGSRGARMVADEGHEADEDLRKQMMHGEGQVHDTDRRYTEKSQDFHAQLATILKSYLPVEKNGMVWDLRYKGKTYRNCELVFWTIMVKCDTDEAELLTGKYRSRSKDVAHLCRYCMCPNEETADPKADFEMKTVQQIKQMIKNRDMDGLKAISQQYIKNGWYKLRFHDQGEGGEDRGIHGATPSEMLHALMLGVFKYLNQCFFDQIGPSSKLAEAMDSLAVQYGEYFVRQSERGVPDCKFSEGIKKNTKIMAKEYRGVLLAIAAVLRSTKGRRLLKENPNFGGEGGAYHTDWLLLVETLLEWEAYLSQPRMKVSHVKRLEKKNRYIMYLIKKVMRREKGMGLRIMKFHAIVHMALDILLYGVPMEHDTGANESGHKVTKVAAKLTQKKYDTFEEQTATRLIEFLIIQLAMAEMEGCELFKYFEKPMDKESGGGEPTASAESKTGGTRIVVEEDGDENPDMWAIRRDKNAPPLVFHFDLVDFVYDLQDKVVEWMHEMEIRSEHTREGVTFRAHPSYRGKPWRDWAMFDWGGDPNDEANPGWGQLPGEIHCFVVMKGIPNDQDIHHGGIKVENGTYAVIETAVRSKDKEELESSDLFIPFTKELGKKNKDGSVKERKFYLADVESIVSPLCVVPDVGTKNGYFQVLPRSEWVDEFVAWLEAEHLPIPDS